MKLTPVPMGIDRCEFSAFGDRKIELARGGAGLVIGYLGTLGVQRRLDVLIEALALICESGLNARLVFVGGSERREDRVKLERRARDLGVLDRIEITEFLPRKQALRRIQEVDIAVSPIFPTAILKAASPTKLIEYMALGLPVVANQHPEQQMVLQASRAGVCVPWGARHFARGIRWLSCVGENRRREMGERGRAWVNANRGYEMIADAVEQKYFEILRQAIVSA